MGTTFEAQIEVYYDRNSQLPAHWQPLSRWELQKDYNFAIAWTNVSEQGWPKDAAIIGASSADHADGYDLYDQKRCGGGEYLELIKPELNFVWSLELCEHVAGLIRRGFRVRVLTWGN